MLDARLPLPVRRTLSPRVEWWSLWALACSGAVVFIEPSPYEMLMMLALFVLFAGGARLSTSALAMLGLLALFNTGGAVSLIPYLEETEATIFIAVSFYLAVTSGFYAMLVQERSLARLHALKWGYIGGATIASGAGIIGYFDIAGLSSIFTLHDRASGTFKDPNVLGAFVVLPAVFLIQDIVTTGRLTPRLVVPLTIILFGGIFLSFSRGAWGHSVLSVALMVLLTALLAAGPVVRARIVLLCILGVVALLGAFAAILSIEHVSQMFEERASLSQSYDIGTAGRFGKQLQAIPDLLQRPNGYGPLQFRDHWGEDPHNVFLNAFASYGWLGGLSYLALIYTTLIIGWNTVVLPGPLQHYAIAIWSTMFVLIFLGLVVDTDHWRHFYMLLGLTWGLNQASRQLQRIS